MKAAFIKMKPQGESIRNKYSPEHRKAIREAILYIARRANNRNIPISPYIVEKILDRLVERATLREYESGLHSRKEFDSIKKQRKVSMRTIQNAFGDLTEQGLLEGDKRKGKYTLSVQCKSDIRYFANQFGRTVFDLFMIDYYPIHHTIKYNIEKLVQIFGTLILFCFMTTATSPTNILTTSTSNSNSRNEENIVSSCLDNIIPIKRMYEHFLAILDYGLADDNSKIKNDIESVLQCLTYPPEHKKISDVFSSESGLDWKENDHFSAGQLNILRSLIQTNEIIKDSVFSGSRNKGKGSNLPEDEDNLKKFSDAFHELYPTIIFDKNYNSDFGLENPRQKMIEMEASKTLREILGLRY
jgi:DNA-binding transcriptional regulator YhcF (GntR family)